MASKIKEEMFLSEAGIEVDEEFKEERRRNPTVEQLAKALISSRQELEEKDEEIWKLERKLNNADKGKQIAELVNRIEE